VTNWKDFERRVADVVGGKRHWANAGGKVDIETDNLVIQCKEVKAMPLNQLSKLVVMIEEEGKRVGKTGLVAIKSHEGRGHPTPALVVMRMETWAAMMNDAAKEHACQHGTTCVPERIDA
jgi:hypothetical protein